MLRRDKYLKYWQELSASKEMVFLSGPRQSGKTTFAENMIGAMYSNVSYFNYDFIESKKTIREEPYFFEKLDRKDASPPLVIFDEIHKRDNWKNYLKGVYDKFHGQYRFLVSGSGRLDTFQKSGDSLAGRYFMFHLYPLTLGELGNSFFSPEDFLDDPITIPLFKKEPWELWDTIETFSGFPEPFLKANRLFFNRWNKTYSRQLLYEDVRDMSGIRKMDSLASLYSILPSRIGSPVSINNLAMDIGTSFQTIKDWLTVFDRFFLSFSVSPWTSKIARAIKKEKKTYLMNPSIVEDRASRMENIVAIELSRAVQLWTDMGFGNYTLHYVRNKEKEEVDFLVAANNEPRLLIEARLSETNPSKSLIKFQKCLGVPAVQLVLRKETARIINNDKYQILVVSAPDWLAMLP
jgi:predicted AAA+ superfamily ATPase